MASKPRPGADDLASDFLCRDEWYEMPDFTVPPDSKRWASFPRLRFYRDSWWRFTGRHYQEYPISDLRAKIADYLCGRDDADYTISLCNKIIGILEGILLLPHDLMPPFYIAGNGLDIGDFESCPDSIVLGNGILNLTRYLNSSLDNKGLTPEQIKRAVLTPLTSNFFCFNSTPTCYDPDAKVSEKFITFLQRIQPDHTIRNIIMQMAGYLLTRRQKSKVFFMLRGESNTGKSTLMDVISRVLGEENFSHVPIEAMGQRFAMAGIMGKLANIAGDTGEIEKVDEGVIKILTGSDTLQVERKFKEPMNIRPDCKMIFACNDVPRIKDKSDAMWNRLVIIPFDVVIGSDERKVEEDYVQEICTEAPAILNWILAGLFTLWVNKFQFKEPPACLKIKTTHRLESNPTLIFIRERIEEAPESVVNCQDLYNIYYEYMKKRNHHPLADTQFGKELKRQFYDMERRSKRSGAMGIYTVYYGIRLITGDEPLKLVAVPDPETPF
jgi:P4 family phage/plasmid primase-like protien